MGAARLAKKSAKWPTKECISLLTRLLRRKFGNHPELGPSLTQLQTLPVEKLEGLTEAIFDWV